MATLQDLMLSAAINGGSTIVFLLVFAFLRLQPFSDRVYYPKWFIKGVRKSEDRPIKARFVNLDPRAYLHFLDWMWESIRMPELELIDHAGLDSAILLRIYLLGLKVFVPLLVLCFLILVPVNATDTNLRKSSGKLFSADIDKLSVANVQDRSDRLWAHMLLTYVFTLWTCYVLHNEYKTVAFMRLRFLKSQLSRPEQFTVLVRQIPDDPDETVGLHVDHFFRVNHYEHYLMYQIVYNANKLAKIVKKIEDIENKLNYCRIMESRNPSSRPQIKKGFLGIRGEKLDAMKFYTSEIERLVGEAATEKERIFSDEKAKLPVAFVTFDSRWGAAVCAQTQQTKDPTKWLAEWAPEPRDVYWRNLAIPYMELYFRKIAITAAVVVLILFFMIPVTFVQSLANIEDIERTVKFLRPVIERKFIKSILQGFLPGLALKIFLLILPSVLMILSKVEGHLSLSKLDRMAAAKHFYFMVFNVFFASVFTGSALQQLKLFLHKSPSDIPQLLGDAIPLKATFFISYIMVDGWASVAGEILRLKPLLFFHFRNMMFVKTEKDREKAMAPGGLSLNTALPHVGLYFLLGLVYAVIAPIILPFIVTFFGFSYLVYRNQVINVYHPEYESAGGFWPHIHNRVVASMIIMQLTLLGLLSTKRAASSTPFLAGLPVLTFIFHTYTKRCFESAFVKFPLEEARAKDLIDQAKDPHTDFRSLFRNSYTHPVLKTEEDLEQGHRDWQEGDTQLVPTKRGSSARQSRAPSVNNSMTGLL
ncbi:CSC1-like protein At1g62320 isoform X1 [Selaginella moellendorffii]|uniref:CSC1-like protein At1g62320 isoform X1 n=1 Tax=Selaginella moellendorffii TaxID=88036 RepID=UPI000D1C54C1|nr:CSC1-like protein At1g62320 isoform X1 [Selaginella moellendorffii]|eukprot:XP_024516363.1 CSC1-like protein At1g62320 isoform X1 [Selaginella moellendorffii]